MNSVYNKKGVALVAAILLAFTGIVCIIQGAILHWYDSAGSVPDTRSFEMEMSGFTMTAYCPGKCCNGEWAGLTVSGRSIDYYVSRNVNVAAVDPSVIPLGARFAYNGREYHAVDIGGKIRGKRIDLLMPDHATADRFGVRKNQTVVIRDSTRRGDDSVAGDLQRTDGQPGNISVQ